MNKDNLLESTLEGVTISDDFSNFNHTNWLDTTTQIETMDERLDTARQDVENIKQQLRDNQQMLRDRIDGKNAELDYKIWELQQKLNLKVTLIHNCANCGAQLHIEEHKPIIHCKYCGSCYVIGTAQINSVY